MGLLAQTWEAFRNGDGVNIAGFAWRDLLGQFAGSMWQPWTPTDASGAALTLAGLDATYARLGNMVIANASITYPVTASPAASMIGGFPVKAANFASAVAGGVLTYHNGATATKFQLTQNATTGAFWTNAGVAVTNAQMSNTLSYIQAIYRV